MNAVSTVKRKGPVPKPLSGRFWAKVKKDLYLECWEWMGNKTPAGYGQIRIGSMRDGTRRYEMAHRLALILRGEEIPHGYHVDHLCRNPGCVNHSHLEIVTPWENMFRGCNGDIKANNGGGKQNREKTHCRNGHPYSEENTYTNPEGHRSCRICSRTASLKYHRNKAKS